MPPRSPDALAIALDQALSKDHLFAELRELEHACRRRQDERARNHVREALRQFAVRAEWWREQLQ